MVNVMGDAAFGMVGLDLETEVREKIPTLIVGDDDPSIRRGQIIRFGNHPDASLRSRRANNYTPDVITVSDGAAPTGLARDSREQGHRNGSCKPAVCG